MTKSHKIALVGLVLLTIITISLRIFTDYVDIYELKSVLGDTMLFWVVVSALQVAQVIFLPISNSIISAPLATIFSDNLLKVFLSSWIGIEIGTIILYFLGRFGGQKILNFLLGDKTKTERCVNFINRGKAFYPIGMLVFIIPDDILTTLAGTSKYNFWYVLIVSIITRGICVATTVFGFGLAVQYPWLYAVLAAFLATIVFITIKVFKKTMKGTN